MAAVTRATLTEAVRREAGLSREDSRCLVDAAIGEVVGALASGETVTICRFGRFAVQAREARMARNPTTGEPAPVPARRVAVFRPSRALKEGVEGRPAARRSGPP